MNISDRKACRHTASMEVEEDEIMTLIITDKCYVLDFWSCDDKCLIPPTSQ